MKPVVCLVANKLFPMASISKRIEDFANEKLSSVLEVIPAAESAATEMATPEAHKDGGLQKISSSVPDGQTLMSLYFALCTKPDLFGLNIPPQIDQEVFSFLHH